MKRIKVAAAIIGLALASVITVPAQTNTGGFWDTIGQFLSNNPTNSWDVSAYAVYNLTDTPESVADNLGAGTRISYWIDPSIGAALDFSYCNNSWTFASLALQARGTIHLKNFADISPYVLAGPGWNIETGDGRLTTDDLAPSIVAVAGGGVSVAFHKLPKWSGFGEYVHITTREPQNRIQTGIGFKF